MSKETFEEMFCDIEYDNKTGERIVCINYAWSDKGDRIWSWIEEQLKEKDKTIEKLNGICAVYDDLLRSKEVKDD